MQGVGQIRFEKVVTHRKDAKMHGAHKSKEKVVFRERHGAMQIGYEKILERCRMLRKHGRYGIDTKQP